MSKPKEGSRDNWDQVAVALSVRAEELTSATDTFASTVFLDQLKTKQNQIISGRRGTGKTHLLKRFEEQLLADFAEQRSIPILVDGSKLRKEAIATVEVPAVIALSIYVEFIKHLTAGLHEFINSRLDVTTWSKLIGSKDSQTALRAQAIAETLYNLVETGEARLLPLGEASNEIQTIDEAAAKMAGGLQLNFSDPRSIGFKVDIDASKELKKSGVSLTKIKGQVVLPFSEISKSVKKLLELLDGARLIVLFDEWSDIDQRLETQPHLADMLKRTLSSITRMHVKLACIPVRTLLATPITAANPIPIGYEIGDDISDDIDLDSIVCVQNDLSQFLPFFITLLKKHMGVSLEWVKSMKLSRFEAFVCGDIFESADVFSELCQASSGVPRDFLQLFRAATAAQVSAGSATISLTHIRKAAERLFEGKKSSFELGSSELSIVDNIYRSVIAKHRTYFFLLEEIRCGHSAIKVLWMERIIHKMPATYSDVETYKRYQYYQMDYGNCVDLLSADATKAGEEKGRRWATMLPEFDSFAWSTLKGAVEAALPILMAMLEKGQALARQPAGNLKPNPKDIIVDDSVLQ